MFPLSGLFLDHVSARALGSAAPGGGCRRPWIGCVDSRASMDESKGRKGKRASEVARGREEELSSRLACLGDQKKAVKSK